MKLIRELIEDTEISIVESASGKKDLYVTGPFLVAETTNRNRRRYPMEVMEKEVNRYIEEMVKPKRALGELNHPEFPTINLERASHLIESLERDGKVFIGKAKVLDTPMGQIARGLIEGGVKVGVSSRGIGSVKLIDGVNVVQNDFRLATAADFVSDPSAPGAFVEGIMEGKSWAFDGNTWVEEFIDDSRTEIRKASKADIESVSLRIFENFIRKL